MKENLQKLAKRAEELTRTNIAFVSYYLLHDLDGCLKVLISAGRIQEAAFFSKTYCPSRLTKIVELWKEDLKKEHPITAKKISNPLDYPE